MGLNKYLHNTNGICHDTSIKYQLMIWVYIFTIISMHSGLSIFYKYFWDYYNYCKSLIIWRTHNHIYVHDIIGVNTSSRNQIRVYCEWWKEDSPLLA